MLKLQAADLSKAYRGRKVVDGISLEVWQGEVVGLLGPNGAGKTTTFYILVGLAKPDSGRVLLDGQEITDLPMYMRARSGISYLPQEPSVFRQLTVEQNLLAVLETISLTPEQQRDRLEELLAQVGLEGVRYNHAYSLSGGERRRLEIARSLVLEPAFILLAARQHAVIEEILQHEQARNISLGFLDGAVEFFQFLPRRRRASVDSDLMRTDPVTHLVREDMRKEGVETQ